MAILNAVWCALIKFMNLVTDEVFQLVIDALAWTIALLPSVPLGNAPLDWGVFGGAIGYFVPLGTMAQHFVLMLSLMLLWYSIEYIMRWIKMIK